MNSQQISAEYGALKKRIEAEIQVTTKNDTVAAYRFLEKIDTLINLQYCATNYRILLESTEDEESRGLVRKHLHIFMTTVYLDYLDEVIDAANSWKADSSGMVSLQRQVRDRLVPVREFLESEFGD